MGRTIWSRSIHRVSPHPSCRPSVFSRAERSCVRAPPSSGWTTAAGLWLVTAIGMCAGSGMLVESAAVTLLGIIALTTLRRFEDKNMLRRQLSIVLNEGADDLSAVVAALESIGVVASHARYDKRLDDDKKRLLATFDVEFADSVGIQRLIDAVEGVRGVRRIILRAD